MWHLADRQLDEFVANGKCEFISAYTQPFAMLVVADLLGVPDEDHRSIPGVVRTRGTIGRANSASTEPTGGATRSRVLDEWFATYIEDRRREPRTRRAHRPGARQVPRWLDPRCRSVVRTATFLFAAGQETTARLLATALKYLAEYPELQDELREHRELHPGLRRRGTAHREPGQGRLSPGPTRRRRSAGSTSPRARR